MLNMAVSIFPGSATFSINPTYIILYFLCYHFLFLCYVFIFANQFPLLVITFCKIHLVLSLREKKSTQLDALLSFCELTPDAQ